MTTPEPLTAADEKLVRRTWQTAESWLVPGLLALIDDLRATLDAERAKGPRCAECGVGIIKVWEGGVEKPWKHLVEPVPDGHAAIAERAKGLDECAGCRVFHELGHPDHVPLARRPPSIDGTRTIRASRSFPPTRLSEPQE